MILIIIGWVCVIAADFLAVVSLWEGWFGKGPKAGLATFFGLFIVGPLALAGLLLLGFNVSWNLSWALVPAFVMIFDGVRRLF